MNARSTRWIRPGTRRVETVIAETAATRDASVRYGRNPTLSQVGMQSGSRGFCRTGAGTETRILGSAWQQSGARRSSGASGKRTIDMTTICPARSPAHRRQLLRRFPHRCYAAPLHSAIRTLRLCGSAELRLVVTVDGRCVTGPESQSHFCTAHPSITRLCLIPPALSRGRVLAACSEPRSKRIDRLQIDHATFALSKLNDDERRRVLRQGDEDA